MSSAAVVIGALRVKTIIPLFSLKKKNMLVNLKHYKEIIKT